MTSSRPVNAPIGDCWPLIGAGASFRQVFVTGLYAEPSSETSPQQPPPQPTSSRPVQTAMPCRVGASGSRRHWFVAGLYAVRPQPQTSISVPVHAAAPLQPSSTLGGVGSIRQAFVRGL